MARSTFQCIPVLAPVVIIGMMALIAKPFSAVKRFAPMCGDLRWTTARSPVQNVIFGMIATLCAMIGDILFVVKYQLITCATVVSLSLMRKLT